MKKLCIIVSGLIVQYPLGGMAWHYFQYVLGLSKLGHDVYYFEDTELSPYNPVLGGLSNDCTFNINYLTRIFDKYGFTEKWAYHFKKQNKWYGLTQDERKKVLNSADILINVSGTLARPEKYRDIPCLVYIDTDPVFTQIKLARGQLGLKNSIDFHDRQFTYGENFSKFIPDTGHQWIPTRQPIVLEEWKHSIEPRNVYTSIMNWTSHNDVVYKGKSYGQKDKEFLRFLELPKFVDPVKLEIAANTGKTRKTPIELLKYNGWNIVNPDVVCPDMESYRDYIVNSKGEWSVAKNGYVLGQAGWFSDRSACYLAAGRPVVIQETGFSKVLPVGKGLLSFSNMKEAEEALFDIENNYEFHSEAALRIAEYYFDANIVLENLLKKIIES